MARISNHEIDKKIADLAMFDNYNATITATSDGNHYVIVHWNTVILTYNIAEQKIDFLRSDYISQTTSTLVGRIVRSLPRSAVIAEIAKIDRHEDKRRISRMIGL